MAVEPHQKKVDVWYESSPWEVAGLPSEVGRQAEWHRVGEVAGARQ